MAADSLSGGTVSLPVKPDTSNFGREAETGIRGSMSGHASGFASIGKTLGLTLGAAAAAAVVGSIAAVVHTGLQEAMDASAGQAQLEAGIKSTGNAANVTVKSLEGMATSLQGMTGQTDDSIVKAEQLLLTFTNIKNVGADKIFDDATKAASDMAAKFGGDASSQAIILGKALNDPVRGVTALTRVGVSFTQGQKDSIKAMVDAGDTIGAQKVILGELTKEFGGAGQAAGQALPGQLAIAQRSFEDFSQGIVETFIPVVLPILKDLLKTFQENGPAIQDVATQVAGGLKQAFHDAAPVIKDLGNFFHDVVGPALGNALDFFGKYPEATKVAAAAIGILTVAAWGLDVALDANPIALVILGIAALIGYVTLLATNFDRVSQLANTFVQSIGDFAFGIDRAVAGVVDGMVNGIIDGLNVLVGKINPILSALHIPTLKTIGHVDVSGALASLQSGADLVLSGGMGRAGGVGANGSANKALHELGDGGTIRATPGGTVVRMAERGRDETVVDTASLNRVADLASRGGSGFTWTGDIYEAVDARATAMQVSRIQNLRRA